LRKNISAEEAAQQGFVTAEYTLEFLEEMHKASPAIIAKKEEEIIGYALVVLRNEALQHPLLLDLVQHVDKCIYQGKMLENEKYVIVGQLCVAKNYRGKGLSQQLYQKFKACYSANYSYCITDVARANKPSLATHHKIGFKTIESLNYENIVWDIVLWDWRN
jgi:L-amino acid N-acyltransferase YncA